MKKTFGIIALAALVMLAGCKKNDPKPNGTRLIAGIEKHKSDSKTSLDGTIIKWSESDKLYVNNGTTPATFTLVSGAGTTTGEFATTGEYTFAAADNLAVYPYNDNITVSGTTVTMTLPAVQAASGSGSFGNGANPMMGTFSDMDNLTLTSLCGVLCLQLTGNNVAITAIEIVGGPDDKLNGTFTVDYMNPVLTYSANGTNSVRLNCEATLTSMAQKFYVVVPAGTLHGFTMKVYNGDNVIFSKSTANEVPVFVNTLSTMEPVEVNPYAVPLTLEALSDGTIVVYDPVSGMQYTLNGGAKQTMSGSVSIDVNTGDKVAFYGNGTSITSYLDTKITGGTADVKVYGNIMSLVDEENFATATTLPGTSYTFYKLFNNYDHLTDASGLLLPATTLASANNCYAEMFSNCDNLVAGPSELPATTLSPRCYQAMFSYCPSLTVAPILPATTLEGYCYYQMFKVCTSLTEAPVLPAPELTGNCYREMFSGCSSLNSITCLATSVINSSNSTFNWVNGVASSGTFTKASGANVSTDAGGSGSTWPRSNKGIPEGWTPVNYGAVLVENITLNKTETTLTVGETETLSVASVLPATATDPTVTWSSNNTGVATVVATTGEVTAVAAGTATITATAKDGSNVTATCAVTVNAPAPVIPAGAINSIFNVGTSASPKYVYFSQGNLQYSQSADKWSFMEHQYDMVETTGMNVGTNYADQDIVSLFGWGTGNNPTKTGGGAAEYENYTEWGTNTIYSGTTATTNWRTLTRDEWNNLFANHQYGYVMISNGSQWICGVAIDPSSTTTLNTDHSHWSNNIYWTGLDAFIADAEAGGWLFLPAAGLRSGTNVTNVSDPGSCAGYYWSSTKEYDSLLECYQSNYLWIKSNDDAMINRNLGFIGHSVRLVKDAE